MKKGNNLFCIPKITGSLSKQQIEKFGIEELAIKLGVYGINILTLKITLGVFGPLVLSMATPSVDITLPTYCQAA